MKPTQNLHKQKLKLNVVPLQKILLEKDIQPFTPLSAHPRTLRLSKKLPTVDAFLATFSLRYKQKKAYGTAGLTSYASANSLVRADIPHHPISQHLTSPSQQLPNRWRPTILQLYTWPTSNANISILSTIRRDRNLTAPSSTNYLIYTLCADHRIMQVSHRFTKIFALETELRLSSVSNLFPKSRESRF